MNKIKVHGVAESKREQINYMVTTFITGSNKRENQQGYNEGLSN